MSAYVVGLVLFAATLHAGWNAIAKQIPSRLAASALIGMTYLAGGLIGLALLPLPAAESWPYIAVSACLQTAYLILLTSSYGYGDFSQLYPLVRGLAVVQVTVVSLLVLGEVLSTVQLIGVAVIACSLIALTFVGAPASPGSPPRDRAEPARPRSARSPSARSRSRRGVGLAVLTSVCIAAYTLVDGQGVRHSGAPLGYAAALFVLQGITLPLTCLVLSRDRAALGAELRRDWRLGTLGGLMSLVAYAIVVWAQNQAPLALVSALRETSVLLAGVLGWLFFRERLSPVRTLLTVTAVAGVVALQLG